MRTRRSSIFCEACYRLVRGANCGYTSGMEANCYVSVVAGEMRCVISMFTQAFQKEEGEIIQLRLVGTLIRDQTCSFD